MFCIKCGKQIDDDSRFCLFCGEKVVQISFSDENARYNIELFKNVALYGNDLVEHKGDFCACPVCSIFQNRVYSVTGRDRRFPILPANIRASGRICAFSNQIFYEAQPEYLADEDLFLLMRQSNRPLVDYRSPERKAAWDKRKQEIKEKVEGEEEYAALLAHFPDIVPKSIGAYRRMKSAKSKNYLFLEDKLKSLKA